MKLSTFFALAAMALPSVSLAAGLSASDRQTLEKLSAGNAAEIQLGQMIQQKAENPSVRDFASRMVEDHQKLQAGLQKVASANGLQLAAKPGTDEMQMQKKLSGLSGKELDHQYIQGMLDDHRKDVAEVANYIATNPNSPIVPTLKTAIPIIDNHLRIAEHIAGEIGVPADKGLNQPEHPTG